MLLLLLAWTCGLAMRHFLTCRCGGATLWDERRSCTFGCCCDCCKILVPDTRLGTLELSLQPGSFGRLGLAPFFAMMLAIALSISTGMCC